jgi:hypothetical protein
MATKTPKTSTVKSKTTPATTTAPKVSRARKTDTVELSIARDQIAQRAYELFTARGYQHGHDVEDWLRAEAELTQRQ